ncbi:MAG: YdcF family protein [Candidatus Nitrotoga sp.]
MAWFFTNLLSAFLLPPLNFMLVGVVGCVLWNRRARLARLLVVISLALLWISSTPYFADGALRLLETSPPVLKLQKGDAEAIIILGAGTYFSPPEYRNIDTVGAEALVRLRYGAKLQRETQLPILVSGGNPLGNPLSEGQQMQSVLQHEFRVPVRWVEGSSNTTLENARNSYAMLHALGIKNIYLVTHAWHMPRAIQVFQAAGFRVIPAPTAFTTGYRTNLLSFIPNAEGLRRSRIFIRELIGILWYRLKSRAE